MSKRFFYVYEDPSYEYEEEGLMAGMPEEPELTDEDLEKMEQYYQQCELERQNG